MLSVKAKTSLGTKIQIPLETETTDFTDDYIRFITDIDEVESKEFQNQKASSSISLDFDLDITPEAEVTVLVDQV